MKTKYKEKRKDLSKKIHQKNKKRIFDNTKNELKNVAWPDKKTVFRASSTILFIVVFTTCFLAVTDSILSKIMLALK